MLDAVTVPPAGFIRRFKQKITNSGLTISHINILGFSVLHITVEIEQNIKPRAEHAYPAKQMQYAVEKQLNKVARILENEKAANVCFSEKFPYAGYFRLNGFSEPDLTRLYEIVAFQAVNYLPGEGRTAFFAAARLNDEALKTLTMLCRTRRYVLTDIASGEERHLRDIERSLGISIVRNPTPKFILDSQAAVFMGLRREATDLSRSCVAFGVNDKALTGVHSHQKVTDIDIALPPEIDDKLPGHFPKTEVVANALRAMTLTPGSVTLRGVRITGDM